MTELKNRRVSISILTRNTGKPLAVLDLAWPSGLLEGLSQPVALLIDESEETERAVNRMGYRYFTDPENFREYVLREILALENLEAVPA